MERNDFRPIKGARTHQNCIEQTGGKDVGVARPGKTLKDKARGVNRMCPNRRIWDDKTNCWVKAWR